MVEFCCCCCPLQLISFTFDDTSNLSEQPSSRQQAVIFLNSQATGPIRLYFSEDIYVVHTGTVAYGTVPNSAGHCQRTVPAYVRTVIANNRALGVSSKVGVSTLTQNSLLRVVFFLSLSLEVLETQSF